MEYPECETYIVEQVACVLGVSRSLAYTMTETGELPYIRLRTCKRIAKTVVKEILQGKTFRKEDNNCSENNTDMDEEDSE